MKAAFTTWLACLMAALSVTLVPLTYFFQSYSTLSEAEAFGTYGMMFLPFGIVGAFIAARRPSNPIGWIFCSASLVNIVWAFAYQYVVYSISTSGVLPSALAVWLASSWLPDLGWSLILSFVLLLFPDGRLPSSRWRMVAWLACVYTAHQVLTGALKPGPVHRSLPFIHNPFGIEQATFLITMNDVGGLLGILLLFVSVFSLAVRFRRSHGVERQQLKWFLYAACLLLMGFLAQLLGVPRQFIIPLTTSTSLAFPVAVGMAVLRYRLWDIDVIIRRTLVYGVLTAILVLIYLGGVIMLQRIVQTMTGSASQLVIVASTLLIAALFQPLRNRIQHVIDRHFYRRRYDSQKTLQSLSTSLRDETDLHHLTAHLLGVVQDTLQPAHVNLWLRKSDASQAAPPASK